jgi:hypothetical protein
MRVSDFVLAQRALNRRAKDTLERTGANDIASTGEAKPVYAKNNKPMRHASTVSDRQRADLCVGF